MSRATRIASPVVLALALTAAAGCGDAGTPRLQPGHDGNGMVPITEINGAVPPETATYAARSVVIQESPTQSGEITSISRTTRLPGTRAPIHMHPYGGTTCVLEGEMTLYLEGARPARAPAGSCYFMPPGRAMTGVNTGAGTAVMLDIFTAPPGAPTTEFREPGFIEE